MRAGFPGFMSAARNKPFNPTLLQDLQLWLDGADPDTITHDESVSPTEGLVSQWDDKSGNGNNVTQGTGSAQPTTGASTENDKNVLDFDGGDSFTVPSGIFSIANGANTIFFASNRSTETAALETMLSLEEAGGTRTLLLYGSTAGQLLFRSNAAGSGAVTKTGATNTDFQIVRARRSGTTQAVTFDAESEATNASGSDENGVDAGFIGRTSGGSLLIGSIAEIIIYSRSLSVSEIAAVEKYLSNKWNIAI